MDTIDGDSISYLKAAISLIVVLCLMLGLSAVMKHFSNKALGVKFTSKKRLTVIETKTLDQRHKLLLIKRDDVEHLIIVSNSASPCIVERNIPSCTKNTPDSDADNASKTDILKEALDEV